MTELLILAILLKEKCTIYKIRQKIKACFSVFIGASFGSLHPALKKLEENAYIKANTKMSANGQKSSNYSITDKGKKYFNELMISEISETTRSASQLANIKLMLLDYLEKSLHKQTINTVKKFYELNILNGEDILAKIENSEGNFYKINALKHYIQKTKEEINRLIKME